MSARYFQECWSDNKLRILHRDVDGTRSYYSQTVRRWSFTDRSPWTRKFTTPIPDLYLIILGIEVDIK